MSGENLPGASRQGEGDGGGQLDMSVEARAKRMGWQPATEFKGRSENHISAEEFVRRGEEHLPILRQNLRKSDETVARLTAVTDAQSQRIANMEAQLSQSTATVKEVRNMLLTADERAMKRARTELVTQRDTAIDEGDSAGAKSATAKLDALDEEVRTREAARKKEADAGAQQQNSGPNPEANAWINSPDQRWYREIPGAKGWAEQTYEQTRAANPTLTVSQLLTKVSEEAPALFGHKYPDFFPKKDDEEGDGEPPKKGAKKEEDDKPRGPSRVQQPRSPGGAQRGNGRGFDDMPDDAKQAYFSEAKKIEEHAKAKGTKVTFTKEEFVKSYDEAGGFDNRG